MGSKAKALKWIAVAAVTAIGIGIQSLRGRKQDPKKETKDESPEQEDEIKIFEIRKNNTLKPIGTGGSGTVYLFEKDGNSIAAKLMKASYKFNEKKVIFQREVESLKVLQHPFIITLHDSLAPCEENDYNFVILMDYIPGGSLEDTLEHPPEWLDDTAKAKIICGIALGMELVHSKSIIHRDLKAANVLIDEHGLPRITDFGSSRVAYPGESLTSSPQLTRFYEAPELYKKDGKYTEKVDVYAFGVILYEIVTGQLAFRDFSPSQLMWHILISKQREPIPEHVTPFTRGLIERCWEEDPNDRPSFEDICTLLRQHWDELFPDISADEMQSFITEYW